MKYIFIFITALLLVVSSADAQPGGGRGKFRNRGGDPMKKLEQLEKVKLIETLNLEEETMLKLFSRRADHQKVMEDRNHKADLILDEMEELIDENKDGSKKQRNKCKNSGIWSVYGSDPPNATSVHSFIIGNFES